MPGCQKHMASDVLCQGSPLSLCFLSSFLLSVLSCHLLTLVMCSTTTGASVQSLQTNTSHPLLQTFILGPTKGWTLGHFCLFIYLLTSFSLFVLLSHVTLSQTRIRNLAK